MQFKWLKNSKLYDIFFYAVCLSPKQKKTVRSNERNGNITKLTTLIEMTMKGTKAAVKINKRKTQTSEFKTGVTQGYGLSTTVFIIALHKVIRKMDQRGTIFSTSSQICAYADDVVLITKTKQKLTQMYEHLKTEDRKFVC
jgi:hypothetical protein